MQDKLQDVEDMVSIVRTTIDTPMYVSEYNEGLKAGTHAEHGPGLERELSNLTGLQNITSMLLCAAGVWKADQFEVLTRLLFNKVQPLASGLFWGF